MNKGAYATGKQIGKATGMFSDFKEEYDKARGPKPEKHVADEEVLVVDDDQEDEIEIAPDETPKKKPAKKTSQDSASEGIGRAVGSQLKAAGGMFSAFKEEFDKARRDD